ncbi:MAG: DUF1887 family CARF protein [Pseudomonadota bacterium]
MPEIHVCLASEQLLANVIPALMRRPAVIHLVVSDIMTGKGEELRRFLENKGFQVELHKHAPDADASQILEYAEDLALRLHDQYGSESLVLNATGGNKLMALGFVPAFKQIGVQVIYTNTQYRRLEILDRVCVAEPMTEVLDVPTYLEAQGMIYRSAASDDAAWVARADGRKALTKYLAENVKVLDSFIGALNGLVSGRRDQRGALSPDGRALDSPVQRFDSQPRGAWARAMKRIREAGLVDWSGGKEVEFRDVESARYLGGQWLEEYAWHVAHDSGLHDVRCNVQGTWTGTAKRHAPRNEFDLLAVHHNRMLVVECKTLRLDNGAGQEKGQTIVTKLDSLGRNAGGLFGTSLLLSAREPQDVLANRCRSLGIPLRKGKDITRLRDDILQWKQSGRVSGAGRALD